MLRKLFLNSFDVFDNLQGEWCIDLEDVGFKFLNIKNEDNFK